MFSSNRSALVKNSSSIEPTEVYSGSCGGTDKDAPLLLRIGNGGAGQTGLIRKLADIFIDYMVNSHKHRPFKVGWYRSDTTVSINYLAADVVDVAITYNPAAESIAIAENIATSPSYYAFRDHFLLVGPPENPAGLDPSTMDISRMFSQLCVTAETEAAAATSTPVPTRFLTRFDKSATNIKESQLWTGIGQVPWATAYSTWYHQYIAFPIAALTAAAMLKEYTLTDRGILLSVPPEVEKNTVVYKAATDEESDLLLNPAHLLISSKARNKELAGRFAEWVVSEDGGQEVIRRFEKEGQQLYSPAPILAAALC